MIITLAELRTQSRQRADMENSNFVSDVEYNANINASLAELHDILIGAYGEDYYIEDFDFNAAANQADYDLPDDFYKLRGVDVKLNTAGAAEYYSVRRFNFNERNRYTQQGLWQINGLPFIRYRLVGSKLRFSPAPDQNTEVKIWYIPRSVVLVNDTDEFDDINGYAEYVIVDAAIKALNKEESDVSVLMAQKEALRQRIIAMAQNRDAGESESVSDIYAENDDYYYRNGN